MKMDHYILLIILWNLSITQFHKLKIELLIIIILCKIYYCLVLTQAICTHMNHKFNGLKILFHNIQTTQDLLTIMSLCIRPVRINPIQVYGLSYCIIFFLKLELHKNIGCLCLMITNSKQYLRTMCINLKEHSH